MTNRIGEQVKKIEEFKVFWVDGMQMEECKMI